MQCSHNQRGASGDRNPERRVHCQEGDACNSDPNQCVSFHLSQCAGRRAPSLLDFGRTKSERQVSLTLPSTPPCQYQDRSNLRLREPEWRTRQVGPPSNLRREVEHEILPYCQPEGIAVIVYLPMASGLLTGAMTRERAAGLPASDWRSRDVEFQRMAVIDLTRRTETLQADLRGSALRNQESRWRRGRECR